MKEKLIRMVKMATASQLERIIYDFEQLGFYREDKRVKRKFVLECLNDYDYYAEYDGFCAYTMKKSIFDAYRMQ